MNTQIDPKEFSLVVKKLRNFFDSKGFLEIHTQSQLSILTVCEDQNTISTYNYGGQVWPLLQTSQICLERELLNNPDVPGFFCISTSYRNEPNPIVGRHDKIFPVFEFECKGDINYLKDIETELLQFLGFTFNNENNYAVGNYVDICNKYKVNELEHVHEEYLNRDYGPVFFLENFPNYTSPYWNIKQNNDSTTKKVNIILHGIETIGSAERSINRQDMKHQFYNINNGQYANSLFSHFTKERVEREIEEFLSLDFFERCGGAIGITRLIRAMKLSNLL